MSAMNWVCVYALGAFLTAILAMVLDDDPDNRTFAMILLWFVTVPLLLAAIIGRYIRRCLDMD